MLIKMISVNDRNNIEIKYMIKEDQFNIAEELL